MAFLFEPYHDDPGNSGLLLIDPKVLEATTTAALRNGWQVCTHAIGDKGNALVLDAYAAARQGRARSARPAAADRARPGRPARRTSRRFAELGVIASMQPSHASDDMRWADARLGPGRVDGAYAWRWFARRGCPAGLRQRLSRRDRQPVLGNLRRRSPGRMPQGNPPGGWHPEQRLSLEETLRGFTAGAAYAAFAEDRLGVLKPGFRADLTIVDRDLFQVKPKELLATRVL